MFRQTLALCGKKVSNLIHFNEAPGAEDFAKICCVIHQRCKRTFLVGYFVM